MNRYALMLGVVAVALALVFAQTAVMAQCGSCDGKPKMLKDGKGPHGQQEAGYGMKAQGAGAGVGCGMGKGAGAGMGCGMAAAQGCPMSGRGMGQGHGRGMGMGMMMAGPVKVNPESQKLWKELERLQVKRHRAMWDMFRLLGAEEVDPAAVQAKQKELWTLNQDMVAKHQALSQFISEAAASACPGCPAKAGASCACPECAARGCKCCEGGECTCGADCKCPCCVEGGKCSGKAKAGCAADCNGGPGCAGKPCGAGAARGCGAGAAGGCGGGCGAAR